MVFLSAKIVVLLIGAVFVVAQPPSSTGPSTTSEVSTGPPRSLSTTTTTTETETQTTSAVTSDTTTGGASTSSTTTASGIPPPNACFTECSNAAAIKNGCGSYINATCICASQQTQDDAASCINFYCPAQLATALQFANSTCGPLGIKPSGAATSTLFTQTNLNLLTSSGSQATSTAPTSGSSGTSSSESSGTSSSGSTTPTNTPSSGDVMELNFKATGMAIVVMIVGGLAGGGMVL